MVSALKIEVPHTLLESGPLVLRVVICCTTLITIESLGPKSLLVPIGEMLERISGQHMSKNGQLA